MEAIESTQTAIRHIVPLFRPTCPGRHFSDDDVSEGGTFPFASIMNQFKYRSKAVEVSERVQY
jgi:hypothetical protein